MSESDRIRLRHMLDAAREATEFGMRHRLIHAYFEIDLGRVCDTLATDLPPLIVQLESILSD